MAANNVSFRYFVLGLLARQSMSGYDVKRLLKGLSWLIGSPSFGSLYPTLHDLLKDGLATMEVVPREGKPPRKIYSITPAGRQVLQDWADQPATSNAPLKAFVMRLILASNFSNARLIAHLQQRRLQVADHQASLKRVASEIDETDLRQYLAIGYALAIANAEMAWLDSTLDQLSQQPLVQ